METSPGWPRHNLANIKKIIKHLRLFGNKTKKAGILEKNAVKSETLHITLLIHAIILCAFVYLWVLAKSDKQRVNNLFQDIL